MVISKRVILFGLEANENFDPGLAAAAAILVANPETNYGENERIIEREVLKNTFGKLQSIVGGSLGSISFDVEIKGIDASPGTAIEIAPILKALGFSEALTPGTSSVYTGPITNNIPSATIYDYHDGTLTVLTSARPVSAVISGSAAGVGMLKVKFIGHMEQWGTAQAGGASTITLDAQSSAVDDTGIGQTIEIVKGTGKGQTRIISDYVGATKVATVSVAWVTVPDATSVYSIDGSIFDKTIISPSYEATMPAPVKGANFTIGGDAAVISNFETSIEYTTAINDDVSSPDGFAHPKITDIQVAGSFDPDKTLVASKDWIHEYKNGTVQAFDTGVIGSTAGNQWQLAMAKTYHNAAPTNSEQNGVSKFGMSYGVNETSGDDRVVLTLT